MSRQDKNHRPLSKAEIAALELHGCSSRDWSKVRVADRFDPSRVRNSVFSGDVSLGVFTEEVGMPAGLSRPAGVYDSRVHNASIGDNALISRVGQLANYDIEGGVVVDNVGALTVRGVTSFGNGVKIDVLNEGGGRELPIFDRLTSQIAHLIVVWRHDKAMVSALEKMIEKVVEDRTSNRGTVRRGSRVQNAGQVVNVQLGPFVTIDGALLLEEGTVWGCESDPTLVGEGVVARRFIVQSGSRIESSAMLAGCFVGQGVRMGKQYSAENSAFFANCEGFHGEAVSLFAGPYTVTHHKSTLLIAGLFSFYNAGSGTNQSNHMYKLGPLHQGVMERGCKTGSFSYLLWPSRVGAYTAVIGKHYANFDTSGLPFSYITDDAGKSIVTPAMNLFTVGTRRDSEKWPSRDRRKDPEKQDLIHFDLFSPYVVLKMEKAVKELSGIYEKADRKNEYVGYNGIQLKRLMLPTCIQYYQVGLKAALGRAVIDRLGGSSGLKDLGSLDAVRKKLAPAFKDDVSAWLDWAGLFIPSAAAARIASAVGSGKVADLASLAEELSAVHSGYPEARWAWYAGLFERSSGVSLSAVSAEVLAKVVSEWKEASVKLNNMISRDATKEFSVQSMTGFGVDGGDDVKKADFEAVRGTHEKNKFVKGLADESAGIEKTALEVLSILQGLK